MSIDRQVISGVAGSISLACWIIVFTPQIYQNWSRQSCEGLSLAFVVIWLLGDLFNVFGALLQHVLPTMIVLAVYYTVADVVLLLQCLVYRGSPRLELSMEPQNYERQPLLSTEPIIKRDKLQRVFGIPAVKNILVVFVVITCGVFGYVLGDHQTVKGPSQPQPFNFWGQVLGWICAVLYLSSRIPQLLLNYNRKSTDGVAVLFFVFTLLGNVTYCASIFAADTSNHFLTLNLSWILGSLGSLILDLAVLFQFWIYR